VFTNNITVPILDDGTDSWIDKIFYVELSDPSTGVSIADSNITVYVSSYEGSVTFTCDDDSPLASWVNASPLFLEHNGAFTFYIPHVGNYTEAQWNQVLSLKTDGHEPGSHTFNHISVPDYVTANGMAAMINDQILTHKAATDAQDIRVSDFAYPFGSHTTATDTELLKYYKSARLTTDNTTINTTMPMYYKNDGNRIITGICVDDYGWATYAPTYEQVQYMYGVAKARNWHLVLYYHSINDLPPQGGGVRGVAYDTIASYLQLANDMDLDIKTVDEIISPHENTYTISSSQTSVTEADTTITLTITRTPADEYYGYPNTTVNITTTANTASSPEDYTALSEMLTFTNDGALTQTAVLSIKDNVNNKPPKTFTVALSNPTGNATLGSPSSVEITIVNQFVGTTDEPGTIGIIIAFIAALLGIFPAIVDLIVSAGVLAVVTILAGVLFTFIAKLKLGW
jgi:peptidoglycan/xylan/chitin deacetylase (PgdA/CDA1 family)